MIRSSETEFVVCCCSEVLRCHMAHRPSTSFIKLIFYIIWPNGSFIFCIFFFSHFFFFHFFPFSKFFLPTGGHPFMTSTKNHVFDPSPLSTCVHMGRTPSPHPCGRPHTVDMKFDYVILIYLNYTFSNLYH